MAPEFHLNTETHGDVSLVVVTGEIDLATAPDLQRSLGDVAAAGDTIADLSGVTFMDSTGLQALISADEAARGAGRRLTLVVPDGPVAKLLRITGVDRQLDVAVSRETALELYSEA
jgi:anti-sigma B factor antagonist